MSYINGYRFTGAQPSAGGTYQLIYREVQTPAYDSAVKITPVNEQSEQIKCYFGQITGDMTLTADITIPCVLDELIIVMPMDSSGHTVTFSTGFTVTASTIVGTANSICIVKFIFDSQSQTWVEQSRAIN